MNGTERTKTVVIGGVAGGMSAATRLRRLDEHAQIVVLERSGYVSYANCGLPYHLGGVISDREDLLLQTPQSLAARFRLDVRVRTVVVAIDRSQQTLRVRDLDNGGEYDESWDHLILSPGARPFVPDIPGIHRAMTLRTVEDMDRIAARLHDGVRTATVIGGGFVGLEVAENLHRRGIAVSVAELNRQVLAPLDPEMASLVHDTLRAEGVTLSLGTPLVAVLADTVALANGTQLPADIVVLAIGVRPEVGLARDAGLTIGARGGIVTDEFGRTDDPRIYAVGDAVEKDDEMSDDRALIPLANIANRQGRLAADHLAGIATAQRPHLGTAIVNVFGLQVGVVGWNEKRLVGAGRPHLAVHTHPTSHAGYFPDARAMSLKLLVAPDGGILGAQGVGSAGIDKRIDVLATAMSTGISAPELAALELAYSPQHGSAKDPINMLGYVAGNRLAGQEPSVQWHELASRLAAGAVVLDVRSADERAAECIPGSLHIPLDELRDRIAEVPSTVEIIAQCSVGQRAHSAVAVLRANGRDATNLDGGYRTWRAGHEALR